MAACPYFDVFSTTIINWSLPDSFFQEITERTVAVARKYGKESERWLMGYNKRPEKWEQIDHVVDMYEAAGVDRLATWTYRGGYGTSVAAKDALELWDNIGRNYKRVLKKITLPSTIFPLTVSVRGHCFAVYSNFCGIFYCFRLD